MRRIRLVAPTDMSVLILGENGTGMEYIAHHLHDKSKRSDKPFVAVDCGSLSAQLASSAFFGHVKGAFIGADSAKKGYFHEAEGGMRNERTSGVCYDENNLSISFALRNNVEDKERILRALKQVNGNCKVAAELLGIGRTTLYSKLEEYGLKYKFKQS